MLSLLAVMPTWAADMQVVQGTDGRHRFEIKVDQEKGKVDVVVIKASQVKDKLPKKLQMKLFSTSGSTQMVELHELQRPKHGINEYQGTLGPEALPVMGFEFRFGKETITHHNPQ